MMEMARQQEAAQRYILEEQREIIAKYGFILDPTQQPLATQLETAADVVHRKSLTAQDLRLEFRSTPVVCDAALVCQYDAPAIMRTLVETYGHLRIGNLKRAYGETLRLQQFGKFIPNDVKALRDQVADMSVREFIEKAESDLLFYLSNLSIPGNFPRLTDLYCMPDLYGRNLGRPMTGRGSAQEIFIGPRGTGFGRLHQDMPGPAVWLLQLLGEKEFVLFPPADRYALCAYRQSPGQSEMFSPFEPFSNRNSPAFDHADIHPHRVKLRAGEILFLPPLWFHTARNLTFSVTIAERFWTKQNLHLVLRYYLMKLFSRLIPFLRGYP